MEWKIGVEEEKGKNNFEKYLEYITQRESIEAQEEFKRGFRTALKTLLETLK